MKLLRLLLVLVAFLVLSLGIFWFLRPLDVDFEASRSQVPHQEFSHFADMDGLRIHYQECGAGTPLILVHGFMASSYDWKEALTLVSNRFRVVAIDLKGFGFSAKPSGDYTLAAQADLVVRLLDHLKIDKAVLCGQSMGGNVVMRVALRHPERVMGLILVDSAGLKPVNGKGGGAAPGYARWPVIGPLVTALALSSDAVVRSGLSKCYFDKAKVTGERVATCYRVLRTRDGLSAAMATQAQNSTDLTESLIGSLRQPTLVIWGAEDQLIPIEAGKRFNALIHGSRLVTFERCGHVPQAEMPRQFAKEVLEFLNSRPQ
ncbi:MAG: alpha/beta hydrolase [Verrucomicrobia bacterium]|nr:alpha/beta hydrolase [Verrucomicrobiota bacterium]